jgi:O-antigen/teichoic acid export membrane protein
MLDKVSMGAYFIALIITLLLVLLSDMGVDLALVKKYPEEEEKERASLVLSALLLRILVCAFFSSLFLFLVSFENMPMLREINHVSGPVLLCYWLQSLRLLLIRVLQAEKLFGAYAGTQLLAAALKVVLVTGLFALGDDSLAHVLLCESAAFFVSIIYGLYRLRFLAARPAAPRLEKARELMRFGLPLYMNALLNLGNERSTSYIVAGLGGPISIALYSIAERLADGSRRLFDPFMNVYLPTQTSHFARGEIAAAREFANRSLLWTTFIVAGVTVAFAVVREPVIGLLFTTEYLEVADAAVMFMCALIFRCIQTLLGFLGVAAGFNYMPVKVSLVSSTINIPLAFFLFKAYGYEGAVVALIITQALIGLLYVQGLRAGGQKLDLTRVAILLTVFAVSIAWIIVFDHVLFAAVLAPLFFIAASLLFIPSLRDDLGIVLDKARSHPRLAMVLSGTHRADD